MIPRDGDIVDLNPLFKNAYVKKFGVPSTFGESEDGHMHVRFVEKRDYGYFVGLCGGSCGGYGIDENGYCHVWDLVGYGFPCDAQLFVPLGSERPAATLTGLSLKDLNTRVGATVCASCGGLLANPMPGMPRF